LQLKYLLLIDVIKAQECDATGVAIFSDAGYKKNIWKLKCYEAEVFLRCNSFSIKLNSLLVCPPTEVFSCALRIR
jgi:hypothetical protein